MTIRSLRKEKLLQRDLCLLLPKILEWDKNLSKNRPTIGRVTLSADGRLAKIHVRFEPKDDAKDKVLLEQLRRHEKALRQAMFPLMTGKILPEFRFYRDDQAEKEEQMALLWAQVKADVERADQIAPQD